VQHLSGLSGSRILVLGHHGSRTSTSSLLLDHLPRLTAAVSSARFRKYGHPHARVRRDLAKRHIPLLRTEEWGNLHFEL
jgi:competence protein ComEC